MGYLNDVEKTKEIFDEDGWYHTGDLGIIDSQSRIKITGRIKVSQCSVPRHFYLLQKVEIIA